MKATQNTEKDPQRTNNKVLKGSKNNSRSSDRNQIDRESIKYDKTEKPYLNKDDSRRMTPNSVDDDL